MSDDCDVTLFDYEHFVRSGWTLGGDLSPTGLFVACVGLAGECGEVLEPIKKAVRRAGIGNGEDWQSSVDKQDLTLELGDALFHVTKVAQIFGITLKEIIEANQEKMKRRWAEGPRRPLKEITKDILGNLARQRVLRNGAMAASEERTQELVGLVCQMLALEEEAARAVL